MKDNTLKEQVRHALDAELSGLNTTPCRRAQYFENATGGTKVKRKLKYSLVLAAALIIALAGAAYAVTRALGILDYAGAGKLDTKLTDESAGQIIRDLARKETEHAVFSFREFLYDGESLVIVFDIIPKDKGMMIVDPGEDSWYALTHFNPDREAILADGRTIQDRWDEGGYTSAWEVDFDITPGEEGEFDYYTGNVGTLDEETGTFTAQFEIPYKTRKADRTVGILLTILPMEDIHDPYSTDLENQEGAYIEYTFHADVPDEGE